MNFAISGLLSAPSFEMSIKAYFQHLSRGSCPDTTELPDVECLPRSTTLPSSFSSVQNIHSLSVLLSNLSYGLYLLCCHFWQYLSALQLASWPSLALPYGCGSLMLRISIKMQGGTNDDMTFFCLMASITQ